MRTRRSIRQTSGGCMRILSRLGVILGVSAGAWSCSASGYGSGTSGSVTPAGPSGDGGMVIVNVVAINGAQSFSPNPATLPAGQRIVWHNVDTVTHRVVLNDGSVDTGNLAPGATSA